MSYTKVILYHANWCGHCKTFMPEWENLKKKLDELKIKHEEYEADKNKDKIPKDIEGYPTIRLIKNSEIDDDYDDYIGERTVDAIIKFIENSEENPTGGKYSHCGGGKNGGQRSTKENIQQKDDKYYEIKYYKYKNKYIRLKNDSK